jgi:hypothetical protein
MVPVIHPISTIPVIILTGLPITVHLLITATIHPCVPRHPISAAAVVVVVAVPLVAEVFLVQAGNS